MKTKLANYKHIHEIKMKHSERMVETSNWSKYSLSNAVNELINKNKIRKIYRLKITRHLKRNGNLSVFFYFFFNAFRLVDINNILVKAISKKILNSWKWWDRWMFEICFWYECIILVSCGLFAIKLSNEMCFFMHIVIFFPNDCLYIWFCKMLLLIYLVVFQLKNKDECLKKITWILGMLC